MSRILVTGRSGQVACSLAERNSGHELIFAARPHFDLADAGSIAATIDDVKPDVIISAAAYTAVDKAEEEPEIAMRINGEAPGLIGAAAARLGIPVLHLSTDYVFDGRLDRRYRPGDPVSPLGIYGQSKWAGEQALAASGAAHAIIRTAWVYSPFGANFVKTMLRLATDREEISVVSDQIGCPTSALDIAGMLLRIVESWNEEPGLGLGQIYHFCGAGETSWAGFAREIFAQSESRGGPAARVNDIATADYPTLAQRPANSRMDCSRLREVFGIVPLPWRDALAPVVERLL